MKRPKQVEVRYQVVDPKANQLTSPEKIPKLESQVAPILLLPLPLPSAPPPPPHGLQGESHVEDTESHPKGGQDWEESKLNWDALRALCVPVTTPTCCHIQVHDHWEKGSTGGVLEKCREHLGAPKRASEITPWQSNSFQLLAGFGKPKMFCQCCKSGNCQRSISSNIYQASKRAVPMGTKGWNKMVGLLPHQKGLQCHWILLLPRHLTSGPY